MNSKEEAHRAKIEYFIPLFKESPIQDRLTSLNDCIYAVQSEGNKRAERIAGQPLERRQVMGIDEDELPDREEEDRDTYIQAYQTGVDHVVETILKRTAPAVAAEEERWNDNMAEQFEEVMMGRKDPGSYKVWGRYCYEEWSGGSGGAVGQCVNGFEWAIPKVNKCLIDNGFKSMDSVSGVESLEKEYL